jgi:predicted dinucleotide-binding enzyme
MKVAILGPGDVGQALAGTFAEAAEFGDMGGIDASRYLEPLSMIWINLYIATNSGDHAFKLLRK